MNRPLSPVFSRFEDSFSIHSSRDYCLSILVSRHCFSYCFSRAGDNAVIGLESFNFIISDAHQPAGNDVKEWSNQLSLLLENLDSLKKTFREVHIAVEYPKSTLVPKALFEEDQEDTWLSFNHQVTGFESSRTHELQSASAVMLYAVPSDILSALTSAFPEATINSASGTLINGLLTATKEAARDGVLYANVHGALVDLVYLEEGRLKFFNVFSYHTREDLAYYVIFVIEQLGLNPDTTVLVLLGDIDKESDHFELLYRYIRNIRLIDNSIMLDDARTADSIPFHKYFNLLNLVRCGS